MFAAVFERDGDWWVGRLEELPRAHTQGRTLDEAGDDLRDVVLLVLRANRGLTRRNAKGHDVVHEDLVGAAP